MKLELKHLAPYLPYNLRCQYTGIVDVNKYKSTQFDPLDALDATQDRGYGLKIGYLKEIHVFKKYWTARCGIYSRGLKSFVNGYELFPILRPLSDLTKKIEVNGERFVPIKKLRELFVSNLDIGANTEGTCNIWLNQKTTASLNVLAISEIKEKLIEWHFDVFGLINQELAIDINTLTKK